MKIENLLKIVEVLGTDIFTGYNINQASRLSKIDVATTFRTLKEMEKKGETLKEKKGNNIFYRLNLKNASALKYCELAAIEKRKAFLLENPEIFIKISKLKGLADAIILLGSFARGEKKPRDIDVLLLSVRKPEVKRIEDMKDMRISPIYMRFGEFKEKLKTKDRVVREIIKDGIVLWGESIYWELIRDAL